MHARLSFTSLAVILLLSSCGALPSDTTSVDARQATDGTCPGDLRKTGSPGAPCQTSADCQELCCRCTTGTKGFAGSACVNGFCSDPSSACAKAEDAEPIVCG